MSAKRFARLKFPIHEVEGDLIKKFPQLLRYPAFKAYTLRDRDLWIKFICYMYDPNSELVREYEVLEERKKEAATLAGLTGSGRGLDGVRYRRVLKGEWKDEEGKEHSDVVAIYQMIYEFLTKVHRNLKWAELCTLEEEFSSYMQRRWEKPTGLSDDKEVNYYDKMGKIREQCKEILSRIDQLRKDIFGDNQDAEEFVYEKISTPENVARR